MGFLVFTVLTVVPGFYFYAKYNLAETNILAKPGWIFLVALASAFFGAYICEGRSSHIKKKD